MFDTSALSQLKHFDPEMAALIEEEHERQKTTINLIASENIASPYSTCLEGSIMANKNTEGYPGKRFVAGCEIADRVELLAIERLKSLFGCDHANVQSMSATIANVAVLNAFLKPGDTILSMQLNHGGHLSHGAKFHYSGRAYHVVHYGVDQETETIHLASVQKIAEETKPQMIICGASSYPRRIDYEGFSKIAKSVGALLFVDLAHNVGLVAAGVIPSPVPYADVITTSTHKTWRGPRGCGVVMCKSEYADKIDRAIFPGLQGAAKLDMIAARAVLFKESGTETFKKYGIQCLQNAEALAEGLRANGIRLVTGGTDTHLVLVDVSGKVPSGKVAEEVLSDVGIIANKNMIPFDTLSPQLASGIRLGSPLMTTRGVKHSEMNRIGEIVASVLNNYGHHDVLETIKDEVTSIAGGYPLFSEEWL